MKVLKVHSLFIALTLSVMSISLTSCFDSESENTIDGQGFVLVENSLYGGTYFEDVNGNTYYPTSASLISMQAAGFEPSSTKLAFIQYKLAKEVPVTKADTPKTPQSYNIELLYAASFDGAPVRTLADEAEMEAQVPETAPVISLEPVIGNNYGSSTYVPIFYNANILMLPVLYYMRNNSDMLKEHKLSLVFLTDVSKDADDLVLYLSLDKGEDNSIEYKNLSYAGYDLTAALNIFSMKTMGKKPQRVIIKAHISDINTDLPEDYEDYTLDYTKVDAE
ncbi:MAG: hypothetical protein LBL97_02380 [Prevotellaceae bacterium]|jgi:hypothetical protein|nr:hypothetical protein [Prevotellaceae bacterium]